MSNIFKIAVVVLPLVFVMPLQAGSGHAHNPDGSHSARGHSHGPISASRATHKAEHKVKQLVKKGKISKSWESAKAVGAEKKNFGKGEEWVVMFRNKQEIDKSKQTLYVFYSLDGHYIAANFTGK